MDGGVVVIVSRGSEIRGPASNLCFLKRASINESLKNAPERCWAARLYASNGHAVMCEGRVCSSMAGQRCEGQLSSGPFVGKEAWKALVFEIRVGRELARRSGMLMFGLMTIMSSRQDERSTMNCLNSESRCVRRLLGIVVGRGSEEAVVASCASPPCAYQTRILKQPSSSDPPGA